MAIEESKKHESTISDWLEEFNEIYGNINSKRNSSLVWTGVVRHVSKVAEEVRKEDFGGVQKEIAYTFCWYLGFLNWCNKNNENENNKKFRTINDLADIIWYKYPYVCPVCGEKPCNCQRWSVDNLNSEERKAKEDSIAETIDKARWYIPKTPSSIIQWKDMFRDIYSNSVFSSSMGEICFHLLEEIGEVAHEIFMIEIMPFGHFKLDERISKLESEIADVFSWMMALTIKTQSYFIMLQEFNKEIRSVNDFLQQEQIEVHDIIWNAYFNGKELACQHCKQRPCKCHFDFLEKSYKSQKEEIQP
jgi:NTP pyrophosphatase (non-canonical NTP hydrolase)